MSSMQTFNFDDASTPHFRKFWVWFGITLTAFILSSIVFKNYFRDNTDELIRNEYYFTGTASNHQGYVQKTNQLLEQHLITGGYTNFSSNPFATSDGSVLINWGDQSLEFYVPEDGDVSAVRLVGIRCYEEEQLFYLNSMLQSHLKLQRENLGRVIFNIDFERNNENHIRINAIRIDENILAAPLLANPSFWASNVAGGDSLFQDHFFLKLANVWLPIGNRPRVEAYANRNIWGLAPDREVNFFEETDQFQIIKGSLLHDEKVYNITFNNNQRFKVQKFEGYLEIVNTNAGDLDLFFSDSTAASRIRLHDSLRIPIGNRTLEIGFRTGYQSAIGTIYCTRENPFKLLSALCYHNNGNSRSFIDSSYSDLFNRIAALKIAEIENSFTTVKSAKSAPDVQITVDPILSKYLEDEMRFYLSTDHRARRWFIDSGRGTTLKMGITLLNTANGNILSAPWIDNQLTNDKFNKDLINFNFDNHPIGSCFKPITLFTAYRNYPSLSRLSLQRSMFSDIAHFVAVPKGQARHQVTLLGYPTESFAAHSEGNDESVELAMAHSSNLYTPITLLYALTENERHYSAAINAAQFPDQLYEGSPPRCHSPICLVANDQLHLPHFATSQMSNLFSGLFDVEKNDLLLNDRDQRDFYVWDTSYQQNQIGSSVKTWNYGSLSPSRVSLRFDVFGMVNANHGNGHFRNEAIPWLLGSQNNRWNNVKLSESFARLVNGKELRSSFLPRNGFSDNSLFERTEDYTSNPNSLRQFANAHTRLLNALNSRNNPNQVAPAVGTWHNVALLVNNLTIPGMPQRFVMLAKTGTSDDEDFTDFRDITAAPRERKVRRGLFMFTIMTTQAYQALLTYIEGGYAPRLAPRELGITGVITLEMTDRGGDTNEYYSPIARDFLFNEQRLSNIIKLTRYLFE